MTRQRYRSLFLRLLLGFLVVMMGIWLFLVAWTVLEAQHRARTNFAQHDKIIARQVLAALRAIHVQSDMRDVAAQFERLQNAFSKEADDGKKPIFIQVWRGDTVIYPSANLATVVPPPDTAGRIGTLAKPGNWVTWVEADRESGLTVRIAQDLLEGTWWIARSNVGFYFLPLLISFPFLLLPVWFIIKIGLRPVKLIIADIGERSASDLSALTPSPYKELSPLVTSVNALMSRLSERLEREQEFLTDAAHELKTPLAVIQLNADTLMNSPDPGRRHEAGVGLNQGVARATHTVHQLLALARSGAEHQREDLRQMDLVEFVRTRIALIAHIAWQRAIEIELQSPEVCMLSLHRESAASLIDNLLGNAVKYSPDKGKISISITMDAQSTRLVISDEGPGIPPDLRRKVFERFFRIPGQDQPGSGLGLAVAERAAAHNHASIHLDSGPGAVGLAAAVEFSRENLRLKH